MVKLPRFAVLASILLLACSSFATTYYVAANGSDSNAGTTTATAWLHAPAMTGCTANCTAKHPAAGDRFILRGGDTWYYNGAGTPTGLPWVIYSGTNWANGTSSNLTYIGVDNTTANASGAGTTGWYNPAVCGSSWCRPIFSGGNPASTSYVSSCAHSTGTFMDIASIQYLQLDNIEFTGGCGTFTYISYGFGGSPGDYRVLSNLYFHNFTDTSASGGASAYAMMGSSYSNANQHDDLNGLVCDNWDGVANLSICFFQGVTNLRNSVLRNSWQGIVTNSALSIHDNLFWNIQNPGGGNTGHSNGMEWNTGFDTISHYFYNNLIYNVNDAQPLQTCAETGYTDYYFNNVVYNTNGWAVANSNYNASGNACASSTGYSGFYSNTLVSLSAGSGGGSWNNYRVNNYLVSSSWTNAAGSPTNEVDGTTATATTYGFTAANSYAPTSATCNGNQAASGCPIGKGNNLTATCNAIPDANAKAACLYDTTLGPNYNMTTHTVTGPARTAIARPSSGAWDAGAYQATSTVPNAPTGLAGVVE